MKKEKDINSTGFAERLKQLRLQKSLSQTELGEKTKTHYTQIGRYELGKAKPSSDTLKMLAEALGVSVDYLYDGNEEDAAVADFKDREFLKIFQEAEQLDDDAKETIKKFMTAFINDQKLKKQYAS